MFHQVTVKMLFWSANDNKKSMLFYLEVRTIKQVSQRTGDDDMLYTFLPPLSVQSCLMELLLSW